jgi:membrane protein YdbS with pleckstrin-like domain
MQEQEFSPHEGLHLIESMINKARNRFSENGHLYLLWGWVVFICGVVSFFSLWYFKDYRLFPVWALTWVAVIYQFFYLAKKKKSSTVRTYTDEISSNVWFVFVIMAGLLSWLMSKTGNIELLNTVILVLYGLPTFLSGEIMKFPPLKIGAAVCWVLAAVSIYIPYAFSFLLISMAVVTAWIVPGYLLRLRYKNQN